MFLVGRSDWTDGAFNVTEQILPPGVIGPPHVHEVEDQSCFVVEGEIGFWVDGEEIELGPGGFIARPAGLPHTLWNKTAQPARLLEISTPAASFERFLLAADRLFDAGAPAPGSMSTLAGDFGISYVPDPLKELCDRHRVSVPGNLWR